MSHPHVSASLRRLVRERSRGCCEYCLIPEEAAFAPHWIDHIVAVKHGGETVEDNLANACVLCNQSKGSDLASVDDMTGRIEAIFHPRRDAWTSHFRLLAGRIEPLTATGRVTVKLLRLNESARIRERELLVAAEILKPSASG